MAAAALIDAGPLVAAGNKRDRRHVLSVRFINGFTGTLVTTWPVLTEVCHLIPHRVAVRFIRSVARGGLEVRDIPQGALAQLADMMDKYADLPMDLADASLVWLGDEMGIRDIVTFDERDFGTYRLANGRRFNNLVSIQE
jgi:predicted nucleic acid-binding protein